MLWNPWGWRLLFQDHCLLLRNRLKGKPRMWGNGWMIILLLSNREGIQICKVRICTLRTGRFCTSWLDFLWIIMVFWTGGIPFMTIAHLSPELEKSVKEILLPAAAETASEESQSFGVTASSLALPDVPRDTSTDPNALQ